MCSTLGLDRAVLDSIKRRRTLYVVYHFISLPYLPNFIRRGGLWCAKQLREWDDAFDDDPQKWGTWQKGEAFSPYISCSVNPPMGMMKKHQRPVLLELNAAILAIPGTAFIGKWSSFGDVDPQASLEQTGVDWLDRMFLHETKDRAEPHPGEFLVPEHIPLSHLRNLIFYSNADREEARSAVRGMAWPADVPRVKLSSQVAPWRFGRKMQDEEEP